MNVVEENRVYTDDNIERHADTHLALSNDEVVDSLSHTHNNNTLDTTLNTTLHAEAEKVIIKHTPAATTIESCLTVTFQSSQVVTVPIKCTLQHPVISLSTHTIHLKPCLVGHSKQDFQFLLNHSAVTGHWRIRHKESLADRATQLCHTDIENIEGAVHESVCGGGTLTDGSVAPTEEPVEIDDPSVFYIDISEGRLPGPCVSLLAAMSAPLVSPLDEADVKLRSTLHK